MDTKRNGCLVTPTRFDLSYVSLGAGVQSTALLIMSALGLRGCPRSKVSTFADTGDEPEYVYEHLALLKEWAWKHGHTVMHTQYGCLSDHMKQRVAGLRKRMPSIPLFVDKGPGKSRGQLMRTCTEDYKILPVHRVVRRLLGIKRFDQKKPRYVRTMLGISVDEASRMRDSKFWWSENCYPLIDANMTRVDCEKLIVENGLPVPKKSACRQCPYHSDEYWR